MQPCIAVGSGERKRWFTAAAQGTGKDHRAVSLVAPPSVTDRDLSFLPFAQVRERPDPRIRPMPTQTPTRASRRKSPPPEQRRGRPIYSNGRLWRVGDAGTTWHRPVSDAGRNCTRGENPCVTCGRPNPGAQQKHIDGVTVGRGKAAIPAEAEIGSVATRTSKDPLNSRTTSGRGLAMHPGGASFSSVTH